MEILGGSWDFTILIAGRIIAHFVTPATYTRPVRESSELLSPVISSYLIDEHPK